MSLQYGLEVCANSYDSALSAQNGGAVRVELCDNLAEGGTTPSYAQIALCIKNLHLKTYPIIRPRGGDFLYTDTEYELMKEDIIICKSIGCHGVVFGILTADGEIDKRRCAELIQLAMPMRVAFHRAFDMTVNMSAALEDLIALGFERVLTSGGANKAIEGIHKLQELVVQANGRISIMPGSGVNESNLPALIEQTGAREFHASAKQPIRSSMIYRNNTTKMGANQDEYQYERTNPEKVQALTDIINSYFAGNKS